MTQESRETAVQALIDSWRMRSRIDDEAIPEAEVKRLLVTATALRSRADQRRQCADELAALLLREGTSHESRSPDGDGQFSSETCANRVEQGDRADALGDLATREASSSLPKAASTDGDADRRCAMPGAAERIVKSGRVRSSQPVDGHRVDSRETRAQSGNLQDGVRAESQAAGSEPADSHSTSIKRKDTPERREYWAFIERVSVDFNDADPGFVAECIANELRSWREDAALREGPPQEKRVQEARAILLTELLRYVRHVDGCRFFSEHRTHCAKWTGFHESRYLDETQVCNCGAGQPCSCGLSKAVEAIVDALPSGLREGAPAPHVHAGEAPATEPVNSHEESSPVEKHYVSSQQGSDSLSSYDWLAHKQIAEEQPQASSERVGHRESRPEMMIKTTPHLCPHCNKPTGGAVISPMASGVCSSLAAAQAGTAPREDKAWLIELGCSPPKWWTGRGNNEWTPYVDGTLTVRGTKADSAIRFSRREDAERALGWLVEKGIAGGCKVTEHIWLAAHRAGPPQEQK